MGVTLNCKKTGNGYNMGYHSFNKLRKIIANSYSKEFGEHFAKLSTPEVMFLDGPERKKWFDGYNLTTETLIKKRKLGIKMADFCFQSDCDGSIRFGACKVIYNRIKDIDDESIFGYAAHDDAATFNDLKMLFKECIDNRCDLNWY